MFCWARAVTVEMNVYKVNWPGLCNRFYRIVGCGEEPGMTVCSLCKCLNGGIFPEDGEDQV